MPDVRRTIDVTLRGTGDRITGQASARAADPDRANRQARWMVRLGRIDEKFPAGQARPDPTGR